MSSVFQYVLHTFVAAALMASAKVPDVDHAPIREEMYVKVGGIGPGGRSWHGKYRR